MTRLKKLLFTICCSLPLAHCGGDGGGSVSSSAGIIVTFQATPQQSPAANGLIPISPAGNKTFFNTEGVKITLTKAYLTLWSVNLEKNCDDASFAFLKFNWLLPSAQAHADDTPTRMGTPNVIDLLAAEETLFVLGETGPPPGDYCGVTVELLKADQDAQYLPATVNMLDRTLYLEGEYIPLGSTEAVPFTIDTGRALREARLRYAVPLTLSSSTQQATTTLSITYDRWFDGVNFAALSEQTQQDWIFNQVTQSIRLVISSLD